MKKIILILILCFQFANASVKATEAATGIRRDALTNMYGIYILPKLPPGKYNLQITATGFFFALGGQTADLVPAAAGGVGAPPNQVTSGQLVRSGSGGRSLARTLMLSERN